MITKRKTRLFVFSTALAALLIVSQEVPAETYEAQSGTKPAPMTPRAPLAESPADPDAERERREQQLRVHYYAGPLEILPESTPRALPRSPATTPSPSPQATQIRLFENHGLTDTETNNITSTVNEPSAAARGQEVLLTANWYAAFSNDGGASFTYLNPANFPAANGGFCCDQLTLYDANRDLMIWFLQYIKDSNGNTARLVVAQGAGIANQQWALQDFTPQDLNLSGVWFDYPAMAVSSNFLYITINAFSLSSDTFSQAVVLRISLAELAAGQGLNYDFFTTSNFSLRPTQGATDTMYFGSHVSTAVLRLFAWPENGTNITTTDVAVQPWNFAGDSGWLGRVDPRITAGWTVGNEVGFAWTATADTVIPNTHVRSAVIDTGTNSVSREPHLWSPDLEYAYPAVAPNSRNDIGVSVSFGNGTSVHPSHAVGVLEASGQWELVTTVSGTHEPSRGVWGDYLSVSRHGSRGERWVATGYSLQGGSGADNIQTRYVEFGAGAAPPTTTQTITLSLERPGDTLGANETMKAFATVRQNGSPQAGVTVNFASSDAALASVSPTSANSNAQGIAETTITGLASGSSNVTATIDGTTISASQAVPVRVPGLGLLGLAVAMLGMLALARLAARRSGGAH